MKLRFISIIAVVLIICATFAIAVGAHNDGKFEKYEKYLGGNSTKDGVNSNSTVDDNHKDSNNNNKHGGSHGSHHSDESDDNEADDSNNGTNDNSTNNNNTNNNTNNNSTNNTDDNNTATPGSGTCGGDAASGVVKITTLHPYDGKTEFFVITNGKSYAVHLEGSYIKTTCGYKYVFGDVDIKAGKTLTVYTRTGVDTESSVYMDKTSHIFNKKETVKMYCGLCGGLITEKSV
jgi:hypothetical protein